MLLRQTRASHVLSIWESFIRRYPTAKALSQARQRELIRQLKPLGFANQRSEALILAAKWLVKNTRGRIPVSVDELLKVPHIGHYSARAILSFAFGKKFEIVDSNVLRFIGRYFGVPLNADNRRNPVAWELAHSLLPHQSRHIKEHNYGLLDFTAEICRSVSPQCDICPLSKSCNWFSQAHAYTNAKVLKSNPKLSIMEKTK